MFRSTPPRAPSGRTGILVALGLLVVGLALGGPLAARVQSAAQVTTLRTVALAPVSSDDRGSILTRGEGTDPVLTEREIRLLDEGRMLREEARARQLGSGVVPADRSPRDEIDRLKLERLDEIEPIPTRDRIDAPDAVRKEVR